MNDLFLDGVSKGFKDQEVVRNISLEVGKGEFLSLLGPSGCGKTTLLRLIAGFLNPTSGTIRIRDKIVNSVPAFKRETGMVFQSYALFPHMTIQENVAFGLQMRKVPKAEIHQRVNKALSMVKLDGYGDRYPSQLSGGQQQRAALARAIVVEPTILLLDEPLAALDKKLREQMQLELRQLQGEIGITTVLVTHDQEEALTMSDRIAVMNHGRIEQIGVPSEIYDYPKSQFVADFIGTSNLLSGRLIDIRRGLAYVEISPGLGLYAVLDPEMNLRTGDSVTVSIRPENISFVLESQQANAGNMLTGCVELVSHVGPALQYKVRCGSCGVIVRVHRHSGISSFKEGDVIYLEADPQCCRIFKD